MSVTIGIFCIVGIWTLTDSLEKNIRQNIDEMGDKIIYIQKIPWIFGGTFKWWEYQSRPTPTVKEYKRLTKECNKEIVKQTAFFYEFGSNKVKSKIEELTKVQCVAIQGEFFDITKWKIEYGRPFNSFELNKGKNVAVIGHSMAVNLFSGDNPVGRSMKVNGVNVTIIGVMEYQGQSMGSQGYDDKMVLPAIFASRFASPRNSRSAAIVVNGHENIDMKVLDLELKRIMRSMRRLKPKEKDDFAINKLTMFSDLLTQTFVYINISGWVIGGLSLLVGGFGIANIMFVSVSERTGVIGLQKSLGAKRKFILMQFLVESVVLCMIGALLGLIIVFFGSILMNTFTDFTVHFSFSILLISVTIAVVIGLIAGIVPANNASNLDPVVAIRK